MDKHGEILEGLKLGRVNESLLKMKKEKYDWGVLRTIEVGHSFSIVIHPEDWNEIESIVSAGDGQYRFRDEQGIWWTVIVGLRKDKVSFSGGQGRDISVDLDEFKKQLM